MAAESSPTSFVLDVARRLKADGRFVMRVEPDGWPGGQLQAVVDVDWAARQAGRLLDLPLQLSTTRELGDARTYTVTAEIVR